MKLPDCTLFGACAVIRANMVYGVLIREMSLLSLLENFLSVNSHSKVQMI